jgi:NAD(P)-dependent dehydrogenase (short-subunit alcohol dehydrogenase family)
MTYDFSGKNAVVTGASRGLGEAIARTLAADGARVALVARSGDALKALAAELPNDPVVIVADLADDDGWRVVADAALEALGSVDMLVNNAGVSATESLHKLTAESLDFVLAVNTRNLILLTHALSDSIGERRGSVVNVSSVAAYSGGLGQIAYSTSKGAVNSFTRNASLDLGRIGVRVNGVAPGLIDDGMWKTAFERGVDREAVFARLESRLPLEGRWGTAQEVADAVAWLASDKASYVTGQTLRVDGGFIG